LTGAVVPPLFQIEVGNSLLVGVRRKRIVATYIPEALDLIGQLPLRIDMDGAEHVWGITLDIAASYGLNLYDAIYLEVAIRLDLPLATLDAKLARAAEAAGVLSPWRQTRN
jgi:predicted nucleic acid-binding protein